MALAVGGTLVFTRFLPDSRVMCHEWRKDSSATTTSDAQQQQGGNRSRSRVLGHVYASLTLIGTLALLCLGVILAALLLQPHYACMPWLGGSGCAAS
jgi:hypothetical protein